MLAGAVLAATGAGGAAEDGAVRLSHLRCIGAGAACGMLCIELLVRRHIPQRNTRYKIAAEVAGEIAVFYARLDTGNRLTDHGGNGVIIADKKIVLSQLSSALCRIIEEGKPEKGVAMRPFFCMGAASQGKLDGVYAKTIHLTSESGERYVAKGYIALGEDIRFDGCDALLSDKMTINRVRGNHHVSNP